MILKSELMPHQKDAIEKVGGLKVAGLFMDMGTGKTRTVLEYIKMKLKKGLEKVIWLCPVSTIENLRLDIGKHSDCGIIKIVGLESISGSDRMYLEAMQYVNDGKCLLVVDESHYIKNPEALRTERSLTLARKCFYKIVMTGTPTPQGVWDLFTQMLILDSRILGYSSWYSFAANHLEYSDKFPGMIERAHNPKAIAAKVEPYVYQVKKEDCLDLPAKTYSSRHFCMSNKMAELYQCVKDEMMQEIDECFCGDKSALSYVFFKYLGFLHRVSSGSYKGKSCLWRAEEIAGITRGIDLSKDKVIVWHKYDSDIAILEQVIDGTEKFNGKMSSKERAEALRRFNNESSILIANMSCGSVGLNLQCANYAIYYNGSFDYAKRIQSEDRIHRIGQDKNCHIIDVLSDAKIDAKIYGSMQKKESISESIAKSIDGAQRKRLNEIIKEL